MERGWDGDDLLDGAVQPLDVVIPIQDVANGQGVLFRRSSFQPPSQEVASDGRFGLKKIFVNGAQISFRGIELINAHVTYNFK